MNKDLLNYRFEHTYKEFRIYKRPIQDGYFFKAIHEQYNKTIALEGNLEEIIEKINLWTKLMRL